MIYYAGMKYTNSFNLGDHIQSLAVEQFLPRLSTRFERDKLREIKNKRKKYLLVANGWFSHTPEQCFPFSPCITPLFFSFHISGWNHCWEYVKDKNVLDFFQTKSPIGCRDKYTEDKLKEFGIDTYFSNCMTLSFPKREYTPKKTKYFLVDVPSVLKIPDYILKKSQYLTHFCQDSTEKENFELAKLLIAYYRKEASAVITTRLHCALPCLAMGIPVLFIGHESDYRIRNLLEINVKIHRTNELSDVSKWDDLFFNDFDFIENIKAKMINSFKEHLKIVENKYTDEH